MAHAHHHNHNHAGHGHHHHHAGSNIKVAFFLNLGFTILEIFGGLWINSVAILSDALHDLGDSLSLGLAWYFEKVAKRGRDQNYTFGYKRFSMLGAVINSVVLLVGSFIVLSEAIPRIFNPQPVNATGMIGFAVLGIIVNGAAVLKLKGGPSLNERVVRLHLMEDVLGWVAVLVGGIVLYFFNFPVIDPLLSLAITIYVLYNVVQNLRESMKIMLQGTPPHINPAEVQARLEQISAIKSVHDLHIWTLDGINHVLTLHAVVDANLQLQDAEQIKQNVRNAMADIYIGHVTMELEIPDQECSQLNCSA
ncbi:cation diffusion facilitator family transporter [Pontibacter silvestris]|uniref:Cation diffusion facilitator family transporter n=1 Tax=Pontibacter silvestris TaxID=2305183 RepID=A0ABW4WSC5_9BACT|nr:cation diffusion facilitator family transporter [Pontibacter silvestris]MCC9137835.1 cation diffusion facilitator family transporter [Pontibacter silvestris]